MAVVVALFAVVLFGFGALVVDVGHAQDVRRQAQAAVDAGALAGAQELSTYLSVPGHALPDAGLDAAVRAAVDANLPVTSAEWSGCTGPAQSGFTPVASTDCIEWAPACPAGAAGTPCAAGPARSAQVFVRFPGRTVRTTVGGIFGVGSINVSPSAAAEVGSSVESPCKPCDPQIGTDLQPLPRPMPPPSPALVTNPAHTGVTSCPTASGTFTSDVAVDGDCDLQPGLYVFAGTELRVTGSLSGTDVTLWFSGTGTLDVDGSTTLSATPASSPSVAGSLPGFAVVFAQGDTAAFDLGTSFDITGTVYAPQATWHTDTGACPPSPPSCAVQPGVLAVGYTDFGNSVGGGGPVIATVNGDPPIEPPLPPHLVQ